MKRYDVFPIVWNKAHTDLDSDTCRSVMFNTYKQAVAYAKKLCKSNPAAQIDCYQINKSDYDNESEFLFELHHNLASHMAWTEKFANGKQCPAVVIGDREIWRWNMGGTGCEDLKPRYLIK